MNLISKIVGFLLMCIIGKRMDLVSDFIVCLLVLGGSLYVIPQSVRSVGVSRASIQPIQTPGSSSNSPIQTLGSSSTCWNPNEAVEPRRVLPFRTEIIGLLIGLRLSRRVAPLIADYADGRAIPRVVTQREFDRVIDAESREIMMEEYTHILNLSRDPGLRPGILRLNLDNPVLRSNLRLTLNHKLLFGPVLPFMTQYVYETNYRKIVIYWCVISAIQNQNAARILELENRI